MTCYLHSVSPVKKGAITGTCYFDMAIQTKDSVKRAVCFAPENHQDYTNMEVAKCPVKLTNYNLSPTKEVMINKYTRMKSVQSDSVTFKFNAKLSSGTVLSLTDPEKLAAEQLVTIKANISKLSEVKLRPSRGGFTEKQDAVIRDNEKCMKLQLFGENVDTLELGKTYILQNVRIKVGKDIRYFNTPASDPFCAKECPQFPKLAELMELEVTTIISARIVAIHAVRKSYHCVACARKIPKPLGDNILITCGSCKLDMRYDSCLVSWYIRALVKDVRSATTVSLSFLDEIAQELLNITKLESTVREDDMAKQLLQLFQIFNIHYDAVESTVSEVSVTQM